MRVLSKQSWVRRQLIWMLSNRSWAVCGWTISSGELWCEVVGRTVEQVPITDNEIRTSMWRDCLADWESKCEDGRRRRCQQWMYIKCYSRNSDERLERDLDVNNRTKRRKWNKCDKCDKCECQMSFADLVEQMWMWMVKNIEWCLTRISYTGYEWRAPLGI